jgi:pimeloyl-ACP methyl ester carboxylesterase
LGFRRRLILPTPLTDDDLERITAPTLVLIGGHSQVYDAREVTARITARMPDAVAEIVPDVGHDLVMWRPDDFAQRIVTFAANVPARA